MDTFYKCCSLHPRGVLKSSWVCNDPVMALTYEFNKKTEPRVGKLFAGTSHQVVHRTLDTSVQTDFGVILEGGGKLTVDHFKPRQPGDGYSLEDLWRALPKHIYAMRVGSSYMGVLLDWFTPRYIVAVYQYPWDIVPVELAVGILSLVGVDTKLRFFPSGLPLVYAY